MATTETEIVNLALDHIGKEIITSLTEQSNEAIRAARQLPIARRLSLSRSPWTFARRTVALAPETSNPLSDVWQFRYDIPQDCLKAHRIVEPGVPVNLTAPPNEAYFEGGKIYTNVAEARLLYVYDNKEVSTWSSSFIDVVALQLALRLTPGMTRKASDTERLSEFFNAALDRAIQEDAGQEVYNYRWGDGYADARMGGERYFPGRSADGSTYWG